MPAFEATLESGDIEAVVAFALRLDSPPPATTSTTTTTIQPVAAVDLYAEQCAACHGTDAEGGVAPPLVGLSLSSDEIADAIVSGVGSMPAFSSELTGEEVEVLVEFMQLLAGTDDGDEDALVPASSFFALGADLYAEQCAACHGADGRGGVARSLRTTLLTGPALIEAIAKGNATMPAFERSLTPGQVARAAEFVEWLKQAGDVGTRLRTGPVIYRQDCAACHGDYGEGGIGPVLARTPLTVNEIIAQIYGGHTAGMPVFAGALDGAQVLDVAQFTKTLEGIDEPANGLGTLGVALIAAGAVAVVASGGGLWYRYLRRRQQPE
jgi:mono/diheme cytochrome c family protein